MSRKFLNQYPHLQGLNKFSRQVASALFQVYPTWIPYAQIETCPHDSQDVYLAVSVPAPVDSRENDLLITSEYYRITVYFDLYHAHFGGWQGISFEKAMQGAFQFIQKILHEELLVAIKPGKICSCIEPNEIPSLTPDKATYIRSWRGTYSKVLFPE